MQEHEAWPAALLNRFLAGPADSVLNAVGLKHDPAHPWSDWLAFELIVFLFIIVLFAFLRPRLSVDKPGALQHIMELVYNFVGGEASDNIDHGSERYVPFFGTLFIFILFMNLIGIIPGFESPTMTPAVPAGLAIATFLFYNWTGIREHGAGRYLAHFAGPMPVLAPLMIPIEFISHLARPLVAHDSSLCEYVRGREGYSGVPRSYVSCGSVRIHGAARFRLILTGLYFYPAHHHLRERRYGARTLGIMRSECEPAASQRR